MLLHLTNQTVYQKTNIVYDAVLYGKIFHIIRSMYDNVKSRVKYMSQLSDSFECKLGVRQGECLSLFYLPCS